MRDAPETQAIHQKELELQAKSRREMEELAKQKNMNNATDEYIEAAYLIKMYHSYAGIRDDPKNVTKVLNSLLTVELAAALAAVLTTAFTAALSVALSVALVVSLKSALAVSMITACEHH